MVADDYTSQECPQLTDPLLSEPDSTLRFWIKLFQVGGRQQAMTPQSQTRNEDCATAPVVKTKRDDFVATLHEPIQFCSFFSLRQIATSQ